jgi:hypothetical protein
MRAGTVLKLSGVAAIAGGALRIANAFTQSTFDEHTLQLLYFATDFFFVLGLMGIYARHNARIGIAGLIGFAVAILGFLVIRSSTLSFFGMGGYKFGATVVLVGLTMMSVCMLLSKSGSRWPALLWLLSLACGVAGSVSGMGVAQIAAGIAFGAGFIVAGIELLAI